VGTLGLELYALNVPMTNLQLDAGIVLPVIIVGTLTTKPLALGIGCKRFCLLSMELVSTPVSF